MSRMAELAADLEALCPLAQACSDQIDTEKARQALQALRDATIHAAETLNQVEADERQARIVAANRRIYAFG